MKTFQQQVNERMQELTGISINKSKRLDEDVSVDIGRKVMTVKPTSSVIDDCKQHLLRAKFNCVDVKFKSWDWDSQDNALTLTFTVNQLDKKTGKYNKGTALFNIYVDQSFESFGYAGVSILLDK